MTRDEKIELARKLRREPEKLTYKAIGERVGVSPSTVAKWLNPERNREWTRASNRKRRGAKLAYQRKRDRELRTICSECGEPMGIGSSRRRNNGVCLRCIHLAAAARRAELAELWRAGWKARDLREYFGWSKGRLATEVSTARSMGFDLPYRRSGETRRRISASVNEANQWP